MPNCYRNRSTNGEAGKHLPLVQLLCLQLLCFSVVALIPVVSLARTEDNRIRLAVNLPLSGPIAAFCGQYPDGLTMGIQDECKCLGIDKSQFVLDIQDNAGKPSQSVTVCRKQMLQPPDLYFSGTSQMSLPIASEISKSGIPHFLVAFDAFLCQGGPNRIRMLPNFRIEGPIYAEYAKSRKAKNVFIMSCNYNSCNEQFDKIIIPALNKQGIKFHRELFEFDNKDYRSLVLKAAQYKPDLIFVSGYSVHLYPIIVALRNYGLIKNGNVLTTLDLIDLLHNGTSKLELKDIAFTSPQYEISSNPKASSWAKRFQQTYKKEPSYVEAYAYDTGCLLVDAYHKSEKVDSESIRKVLPYKGICGEINIDKYGDLSTKLHVAQVTPTGGVKEIPL